MPTISSWRLFDWDVNESLQSLLPFFCFTGKCEKSLWKFQEKPVSFSTIHMRWLMPLIILSFNKNLMITFVGLEIINMRRVVLIFNMCCVNELISTCFRGSTFRRKWERISKYLIFSWLILEMFSRSTQLLRLEKTSYRYSISRWILLFCFDFFLNFIF